MKLWGNIISQPSRTLQYILAKLEVDHEFVHTGIPDVTRSEQFKKDVNHRGQIPVLEVDGEKFTESAAIARFLLDSYDKDETLLPRTDRKHRAKVEALLDMNGTIFRQPFIRAYLTIVVFPMRGAPAPDEETKEKLIAGVHEQLKFLDETVKEKGFLAGSEMTIADVQVYNEVTNVVTILALDLNEYPNLLEWRQKVHDDQVIAELDTKFYETVAKFKEQHMKSQEEAKE